MVDGNFSTDELFIEDTRIVGKESFNISIPGVDPFVKVS
jgi:hypothetical protein